jgi:hypothetical protein
MKRIGLVVVVLIMSACGGTTPATPTPVVPVVAACQANNTADIKFENRSNINRTYDVVWDGSNLMVLAPGTISAAKTVSANVAHRLDFKYTNTSTLACATATPNLTTCSSQTYWCTF